MAIDNTSVSKTYTNVQAGVPISVDMPLYSHEEIHVYYGDTRQLAVYAVDYTITLLPEDFITFTFTPTPSLIAKIGALGQGNVVELRRFVPYVTDFSVADSFIREKLVTTINRIMMRFQQIAAYLKTGANHNITISTEPPPPSGEEGDIWIQVPPA